MRGLACCKYVVIPAKTTFGLEALVCCLDCAILFPHFTQELLKLCAHATPPILTRISNRKSSISFITLRQAYCYVTLETCGRQVYTLRTFIASSLPQRYFSWVETPLVQRQHRLQRLPRYAFCGDFRDMLYRTYNFSTWGRLH
jgi:hypothetical protein